MTNVNVYGGSGGLLKVEQFAGSDFSGSDGDSNRTVTIGQSVTDVRVLVQGRVLHKTQEYTLSGATLTIIGALYDSDIVDVWY